MNEYRLSFEIEPCVKGRPRFTRSGHAFTPAKTREFESKLKAMAIELWNDEPLAGPLRVKFKIICKRPKKPSKPYPRGDTDNYAKAVSDALNGVIWVDDSQIIDERTTKEYGDDGRIEVTLVEHSYLSIAE